MTKTLTDLTHRAREDWRWRFLEMLAKSACVSTACTFAGVSSDTAYKHRESFPKFRRKWDEALEIASEVLEVECRIRALDRGDRDSARLLTFLLQAQRPSKYRDTPDAKVQPAPLDNDPTSGRPALTPEILIQAERELSEWRAKQKAEIERLPL
jgi:hypothetical protein